MSEFAIMPLSDYKNFCDAVREKTGETDAITSSQMQDKTEDVYESGKRKERDAFWDVFQNNGGTRNYCNAFSYGKFTDENYNPEHDIRCSNGTTSAQNMFYNAPITDTKVAIYANNNNVIQAFMNSSLQIIRKLYVYPTTVFTNTFSGCTALTHLIMDGTIGVNGFNAKDCPLDKESLVSIFNALSTETSGLTVTLSLDAVNKAFETSAGANDGNTSAEWLALTQQRTNWTITLA